MDDVVNSPRIYISLEQRQIDHKATMVEEQAKINFQYRFVLINLGSSHSFPVSSVVVNYWFGVNKLEAP
jgi:hypothetical protein